MNETFGQRFQRLRKAAELTQEDVATKLNITAQAVSKWEKDASAPDISVLTELADMLNVSTDVLLGKHTDAVVYKPQSKSLDELWFRVRVLSTDGDKVNVNLPLSLIKMFSATDADMLKINGKDLLNGIDIEQLIRLAESGVLGKLVEIESADGDLVEVFVE